MNFKRLTPAFSVSPQLTAADVAQAAQEGYRAIINNRPDGEQPGQITAAEVALLAAAHGMAFAHIPTPSGKFDDPVVMRMAAALGSLDTPVLAYCRTGARSAALWALSQADKLSAAQILSAAQSGGYDLSLIVPRLQAKAGRK